MESPFILEKGEKIIKEFKGVQYSGVTYVVRGSGTAIGSGIGGGVGLGSGLYSGKQVKREGSVLDAKLAHGYLTNHRLIFCHTKFGFFSGKEKPIGTPFAEIVFKNIKGIKSDSKWGNPAIDSAIIGQQGGIDNVKFWFIFMKGKEIKKRTAERDELYNLIKKQLR